MMKKIFISLAFLLPLIINAQQKKVIENILVITTDGFRWQEVFKGMDPSIANDGLFNGGDSLSIYKKYWATTETERRQKLLPFIWNTIGTGGQIYGNRMFGNKVDNANKYKFSYPGYNEIFTGFPDTLVNSNDYPPNPHINVLEYINRQPGYQGKVAAFTAWEAFNRILNEERSGIPVVAAFDATGGNNPSPREQLLNDLLKDSYKPFHESECLDLFTHYAALEYLKNKKPKALYISYGETDEFAHAGRYLDYLNSAHQFDQWLKDLWNYIQSDPTYKNKTALLITVDHGRGDKIKKEWTSHGEAVADAHEIWFAVMGPGLPAKGEVKTPMQLYQKQFAQTIASLLGMKFTAAHSIAESISEIYK